jgi:hypothetical protein
MGIRRTTEERAMSVLSTEQRHRSLEIMQEYLAAKVDTAGKALTEVEAELDQIRGTVIENELSPLLAHFLSGDVPLADFKSKIDSINKRNEYWGFKGTKGQMFFNMLVNVTDDPSECAEELKAALTLPANDSIARSRIKTFVSYVHRIGEQHVLAGGTKHQRPKFRSVPFFLSYFWQIQDRHTWPVYYTSSVNIMTDLNLWQPSDDVADCYVQFKHLHQELGELFTHESGRPFGLYDVEHIFWMKGGKPDPIQPPPLPDKKVVVEDQIRRLPESYVPPIISILPRMARNEPNLITAAKASGLSLDRAFEKNINAAFTMLGYDTKLLGQGQGRVPDGMLRLFLTGPKRCGNLPVNRAAREGEQMLLQQNASVKRTPSCANRSACCVRTGS